MSEAAVMENRSNLEMENAMFFAKYVMKMGFSSGRMKFDNGISVSVILSSDCVTKKYIVSGRFK